MVAGIGGILTMAAAPTGAEPPHTSSSRFETYLRYQNACSRCHETQPSAMHPHEERMHLLEVMRYRANLTDRERDAILTYLSVTEK
jgi:hypothetical protein